MMKNKMHIVLIFSYLLGASAWLLDLYYQGFTFDPTLRTITNTTIVFLAIMTTVPFAGSVIGIMLARQWGGTTSYLGRALIGISLGLLSWACGMIVWNVYLLVLKVEVPYPSSADYIFIMSWPLWIYGVLQLTKVVGVRSHLQKSGTVIKSLPALFFTFAVICYGTVWFSRSGTITDVEFGFSPKLFFDVFYPLGTILISSVIFASYLWSKNTLGGKLKRPILFIFAGFIVNYFADTFFSYSTNNEAYFNGHFSDMLFLTAMFLISFGVSKIRLDV